jgi:hypothetical protein
LSALDADLIIHDNNLFLFLVRKSCGCAPNHREKDIGGCVRINTGIGSYLHAWWEFDLSPKWLKPTPRWPQQPIGLILY